MKHTYLLIAALPSTSSPTERTWSHYRQNFAANCTNSYVSNSGGHKTESHQISTRWTEITDDYSAEIKIVILQSVFKLQRDEWRSSSNCGRNAANIARFNSVNSEITWRKFTKFGHDVPWLLLLKLLKADLRSANPLSNAERKSNGHSTRRLRTSLIFNWLP